MELTELREKFDTEIGLMPLADQSRKSYRSALNKYLKENNRVYRMSEQDVKVYMSNFNTRYSNSYYNVMGSTLLILYCKVLSQSRKLAWWKPLPIKRQFRDIITNDEFIYMMKNMNSIKHKAFTIILYSTGIRLGELLNLKIKDIGKNKIFIESLKGGKNRYSVIHKLTRRYLDVYIKQFNPSDYLFEGPNGQYSATSIRKVLQRASKGLNKHITPHLFRHSYCTKVIERENIFLAQELMGHRSLNSTLFYNHVPEQKLITMYNPLDEAI